MLGHVGTNPKNSATTSAVYPSTPTFRNTDNNQTSVGGTMKSKLIEAHGIKGMKSIYWRKVFRSVDALNAWILRNDAEIWGTRYLETEGN
jgi:hypothetical protein